MSFKERVRLVFTLGNSIKLLILSSLTFGICYGVSCFSNNLIKDVLNRGLSERARILELDSKKELTVIKCVLLDCKYISSNNKLYRFENSEFILDNNKIDLYSSSKLEAVTVNGITYYLNKKLEDELFSISSISSYTAGSVTFFLLFIYVFISYNSRRFNYRVTKDMLEDLIQKELTESLHHELSGPIVVLESKIEMLKKMKDNDPEKKNILENLDSSIVLIRDILNVMANRKHLKYTNGTIPIERLIENSIAFNRIKHLGMADIEIENKELFSQYSLLGMDNGVLVNILNNLITNSTEAGASNITIRGEIRDYINHITGEKYPVLDIYCKDNGSGIRDKNGKISKNKNIFEYSYSTKDNTSNIIQVESKSGIWNTIKSIFGGIEDIQSVRGAGLAISKKLLISVNNDIVLHETSENGTTFRLTVRVKPRVYNEDESRLIEDIK